MINLAKFARTETLAATGENLAVADGYEIRPHDWGLVTGGGDWDERRAAEFGYLLAVFEQAADVQSTEACCAHLRRIKSKRGI